MSTHAPDDRHDDPAREQQIVDPPEALSSELGDDLDDLGDDSDTEE
jgi:hypothetical protein